MNLKLICLSMINSFFGCQSKSDQTQKKQDLLKKKDTIYRRYDSLHALYVYYNELANNISSHKIDSLYRLDTDKKGKLKLDKLLHVSIASTLNHSEKLIFERRDYYSTQYTNSQSARVKINQEIDKLNQSMKTNK